MHGLKRSWSGTAIVPRDNESNSHYHRILILSASMRILWMNYFQCTEKVDGYPLDCKFTFKRLETFVTLKLPVGNFEIRSTIWVWRMEIENVALTFFIIRGDMCPNGFYAQKKDRNQIDVPWHFPISRCSSILIFLVLVPFINSQPKYQHNILLTLAFSK